MYDFVISRQQFPKVKWPKMSQSYQLLRSRLPEANDRCQNNRKANPIWTWVLVTFSFCLLTVLYNQQPHYHSHLAKNDINYKIHSEPSLAADSLLKKINKTSTTSKKTILFWNSYWHWKHFQMGTSNRGFEKLGCNFTNCYTTTINSKLRDPNVRVDAVLFHGVGLKIKDVKMLKKLRKLIPKVNQGHMPIFVLFMLESPLGANLTDNLFDDFFDLTITYRQDADIQRPYGGFVNKNTGEIPLAWRNFETVHRQQSLDNVPSLDQRPNDIAWIVSHCETESKREAYVERLKKATRLRIDIYGKCGNLTVSNGNEEDSADGEDKYDLGYRKLMSQYKFYLSFENSLCEDYVTEKFYNVLRHGGLPVVNGGIKVEDYHGIAPPHSFIHVNDFASVEDLAKALEGLSRDASAYGDYFWWRQYYSVRSQEGIAEEAQCKLCDILNLDGGLVQSPNDYSNFKAYWHRCRKADITSK